MLKRIALVTMVRGADCLDDGGWPERRRSADRRRGSRWRSAGRPGRPAGAQTAPGTPPAAAQDQQPPAQPTFRAGINFVRVDVIATDNKGNAGHRPDAGRSDGHRGRQAAGDRVVQADQGRRAQGDDARRVRSARASTRSPRRSAKTCGCSPSSSTTTTCAAARRCMPAQPLMRFLQNQLQPADMVALMYPLTPLTDLVMTRNHEALARAVEQIRRPQVRLHAAGTSSRRSTPTTRPSSSSGCATRCRSRRCDRS